MTDFEPSIEQSAGAEQSEASDSTIAELNELIEQMRQQIDELRAGGVDGDQMEQQLERITRLATEAASILDAGAR